MTFKTFAISAFLTGVGLMTISCEKESLALEDPTATNAPATSSAAALGTPSNSLKALLNPKINPVQAPLDRHLPQELISSAVEPSECAPTALNEAIVPYAMEFGDLEWEWYDLLSTINYLYTLIDTTPQYFGIEGQLTNFAAKHTRNLESFWKMPNMITVRGEHTSTLQNRDAIAAVYIEFAGLSAEEAYANADYLIENVIKPSEAFQDTPLLSLDGFASYSQLIVIGDGIVQVLVDAGVDEKVVFAGILGHEWGHQLQFINFEEWYGVDVYDQVNTPESTRMTELEADFLTGYYLTHKRGGTYNWKRAQEFFELFFNIGDCSFTSAGHHGTPIQRMAAAELGYLIAQNTFPKGKILEADELHAIFMANLDDILQDNIGSKVVSTNALSTIY